jgi:two-component system LytT family sensor kinase
MKIRLRMHERIFVSLLAVLILTRYLLPMLAGSVKDFEMPVEYAFVNAQFPFHLFRNILLPDIGLGLLIYFCYLWINGRIIPSFLPPSKIGIGTGGISFGPKGLAIKGTTRAFLGRSLIAIGQLILIFILLTAAYCTAGYLRNEYMFQYAGFTIFPKAGFNPNPQIDIHGGINAVAMSLFIYLIWVCLREAIIAWLERPGERRDYRIVIANQVTGFLAIYAVLPIATIGVMPAIGGIWLAFYASLFPSACLVFINLYWLFPIKGERPFYEKKMLAGLLLSSFLCAFPVLLFSLFAFLLSWVFLLLVVIPFSWLLYRRQAARILQLRGLEKALVRSNANLQFLRSRINPHFLFNALNTLYGTALMEGAEHTGEGIQKLGDMMRFMLHENNEQLIPVEREVEYLQNYISLQKLRIESSPDISIEDDIHKRAFPHQVEPMLFIPFVENAFKHGISLNKRSWIKIKFDYDERDIRLEVRNSMHVRDLNDPEKEGAGIGLKNVLMRLKLLYPGRFEFSAREEGNEFVVHLSVRP